jgi:four helix bundle protein
MKILKFEDLLVWQKSIEITVKIYNHFEKHPDFGYSNQIRRASISISNNIAEGFERSTNKDFNRFLYIAKGSCSEVKSMLFLGFKLGYFSDHEMKHLFSQLDEIGKMLFGLSKSLKTDHCQLNTDY